MPLNLDAVGTVTAHLAGLWVEDAAVGAHDGEARRAAVGRRRAVSARKRGARARRQGRIWRSGRQETPAALISPGSNADDAVMAAPMRRPGLQDAAAASINRSVRRRPRAPAPR